MEFINIWKIVMIEKFLIKIWNRYDKCILYKINVVNKFMENFLNLNFKDRKCNVKIIGFLMLIEKKVYG